MSNAIRDDGRPAPVGALPLGRRGRRVGSVDDDSAGGTARVELFFLSELGPVWEGCFGSIVGDGVAGLLLDSTSLGAVSRRDDSGFFSDLAWEEVEVLGDPNAESVGTVVEGTLDLLGVVKFLNFLVFGQSSACSKVEK